MGTSFRRRVGAGCAALSLVAGVPASLAATPTLMGQAVQVDWRHFHINDVYLGQTAQFVVGPGVELPSWVGDILSIDVTAGGVALQMLVGPNTLTGPAQVPGTTFNGFALFDYAGTLPAITSAVVNPATTLAGVDASRLSFDADHVYANLMGLPFNRGDVLLVDVALVPEPQAWALWMAGLAGLGLAGRARSGRAGSATSSPSRR
jgi:hypothetical protein